MKHLTFTGFAHVEDSDVTAFVIDLGQLFAKYSDDWSVDPEVVEPAASSPDEVSA